MGNKRQIKTQNLDTSKLRETQHPTAHLFHEFQVEDLSTFDVEQPEYDDNLESAWDNWKTEAYQTILDTIKENCTQLQQKYTTEYFVNGKTFEQIAAEYDVHYHNVYSAVLGQKAFNRGGDKYYGGSVNKIKKTLTKSGVWQQLLDDAIGLRERDQDTIDRYKDENYES